MRVLGLDVGGANIKAADSDGNALTRPFAVWKAPEELPSVIQEVSAGFAGCDCLAVTMTAELADCFSTKSEGVDFILGSVERAARGRPVWVWQTAGEFVSPDVAREFPFLVAAANWHALATWCGRMSRESASLMIDVGTTTTDIIPLVDGVPFSHGLTDVERMQSGELVYTGVRRTPVCAVVQSVPLRGGSCPVAAELFATMHDVYLILGDLPEDPGDCETASGRPATVDGARDRLARMLCCDRTELTAEELDAIARYIAELQRLLVRRAVDQVLKRLSDKISHLILSGAGEFLSRLIQEEHPQLRNSERLSLGAILSPDVAEAACAFAVARLATERLR